MKRKVPETKADRFVRVAENRTKRLLREIKFIGNLSARNNYAYTEEQVNQIFDAAEKELKEARARFVIRRPIEFRLVR